MINFVVSVAILLIPTALVFALLVRLLDPIEFFSRRRFEPSAAWRTGLLVVLAVEYLAVIAYCAVGYQRDIHARVSPKAASLNYGLSASLYAPLVPALTYVLVRFALDLRRELSRGRVRGQQDGRLNGGPPGESL